MNHELAATAALTALSACWAAAAGPAEPAGGVRLEQIVSREDALFRCRDASMTLGRDGRLYFSSAGHDTGFVLRVSPDGKEKYGKQAVYAIHNATANAEGVAASANAHFAHKVVLYSAALEQTGDLADFLVSDAVGWDAPSHVEAGAGGDFYGVDQHRDRIVRLSPAAKIVRAYAVPREPAGGPGQLEDFRVCEKREVFFLLARDGSLRCAGFDGKTRWKAPASSRAFDCDDEGTLYLLQGGSDAVKRFGLKGEPLPDLKLQLGDHRPAPGRPWYSALRADGKSLFLRAEHDYELFQRYDLATGAFQQAVTIDHERFAASLPGLVWTAGQPVPLSIAFDAGGRSVKPRWRVWARPLEAAGYREFKLAGDRLDVPADCAGVYRVKITPEASPTERGGAARLPSEYLLQAAVEIRTPDAKGSLAAATPESRLYYARGEAIPVTVSARGPAAAVTAVVRLTCAGAAAAEIPVEVKPGAPAALTIPPPVTASLRPGEYLLAAAAAGMTCIPQRLVLGPALRDPPFFFTQYGDYGCVFPPQPSCWSAPDVVSAHLERTRKLGFNLMVDRLGWDMYGNEFAWQNPNRPELEELAKRLASDPLGPPPEKTKLLPPLPQILAGYGANGIREMAILMMNDAGLPLGTGFDNRKPDQILATLRKIADAARPYAAFRGWTWSSNWWVFDKRGANAAKDAQEKAACEAALKQARETGAWAPVLEEVAGRRLGYAVDAQELFNNTLRQAAPDAKYVTASAAPYRNVEAYPPVTFRNVDEVDLHIQWEQIAVPYHAAHNVDFYKRPGKRGWAHPEVWNDDGTGGQIVPTLFQIAMRGGDGAGLSGDVPPWAGAGGGLPDDPRTPHYGTASVVRALGGLFRAYGPLFAALENDDRVAIAASGRMYKLDDWKHVTGLHFARELEAYISCLHAHHPARILFAEDVKPDSFKPFKAVLVADQRVEMEPELLAALRAAKAAGTTVLYDGTCREALVKEFTPLGLSFDHLEKDRSPAGDDAAYWRFAAAAKGNLPVLAKALDAAAPPAARVEDDEVLISQRRGEEGRYLWVVNNTLPRLDPGVIWRMTLGLTSRVPLVAPVAPAVEAKAVYDVFAMKPAALEGGALQADLRSLPGRLYALLPAPIAQVELKAPAAAKGGQPLAWTVRVLDAGGRAIPAPIPVRVRLSGADGSVLDEQFAAAGSAGASGAFVAPLNAPKGPLALEAAELLSGRAVRAALEVSAAGAAAVFVTGGGGGAPPPPAAEAAAAVKGSEAAAIEPADAAFGPHVRDLVLADGGKLAVMNAMNWDHNLYAVDVESGKIRWRQRAGHYFAFEPRALADGVAAQGFDFKSAAGYHLYLAGNDGRLERRFPLYGVPGRLPHRFVPAILHDRINQFAVPPDGSWVASAGDLGLAAWSRDGKLLWSHDWWKEARRKAVLAALDAKTILVIEGLKATAVSAADGSKRWEVTLGNTGEVTKAISGPDGRTALLLATTEGGRVFVLRDGKLLRALPTTGSDAALSPDGARAAVTAGQQLKLYSLADGLQWTFGGDDRMRFPRFAPDGRRLAAASDLGSVYVLDPDGGLLWEKDLGARAVPAWLPGGDLLLATCQGTVCRVGADTRERWRTRLDPAAADMRDRLLADDGAPTAPAPAWGNAEAKPRALEPNLLAGRPAIIRFVPSGDWGGFAQLAHDPKLLCDGKADPPPAPWIDWSYVGFFAETSPVNYLLVDAYRTQLRVEAATLVEDPAHPESWLRDVRFDSWDAAKEAWVPVQTLLSDAPVHTHRFAKPVESARFRFYLPWGVVGNLRLGEIVFHGEALGCSHPDAVARKSVAVLFDEQDELKKCMAGWGQRINFKFDGAYSGGRCLALPANANAYPEWQPPIGHFVPHWDFEIVEKPQPGQYRYLQFAWKAAAPDCKGITLAVGGADMARQAFHAGAYTKLSDVNETPRKLADAPPADWKVERVDLWELLKKPGRLQQFSIGTSGGGALVDQILLGRTEKDLQGAAPAKTAK